MSDDDTYATLEDVAEANVTDHSPEGTDLVFKIEALTEDDILEVQSELDMNPDEMEDAAEGDLEENVEFMNHMVYRLLKKPELDSPEDAEELGKFRRGLLDFGMEWSGLAEAEPGDEDAFQEDGA